jgi:hypothetical protein
MSEIDALRESLSYRFWDDAAYVALALVFIGVVGESIKELTSWIRGHHKKKVWGKVCAVILIAGLAGEIMTTAKNEANNSIIVGILNAEANEAIQRTKGDEALISYQSMALATFEADVGNRLPKVEQNVTSLSDVVTKTEYPPSFDPSDLRRTTRGIPSALRVVTLLRLADPVMGPYADRLKRELEALQPPFSVSVLNLLASEFRGVIVCRKGSDDDKVGKALQDADIVSEIKPMDAPECQQFKAATYADWHGSYLPFSDPKIDGTLIYVGHRYLPPQQ